MKETTEITEIAIPENCSAGKLLTAVHQCKGSVYLTGDGFSLCLTSMLCRYVAVDKIIHDCGKTKVSLAFTVKEDRDMIEKKITELVAA